MEFVPDGLRLWVRFQDGWPFLLGMRRRSWLHSDLDRLNLHTGNYELFHQIALWTSFPMPLTASKSDSRCSQNTKNKIVSIPPKPAYKSWKPLFFLSMRKSTFYRPPITLKLLWHKLGWIIWLEGWIGLNLSTSGDTLGFIKVLELIENQFNS